jgi:hypothetical protein
VTETSPDDLPHSTQAVAETRRLLMSVGVTSVPCCRILRPHSSSTLAAGTASSSGSCRRAALTRKPPRTAVVSSARISALPCLGHRPQARR